MRSGFFVFVASFTITLLFIAGVFVNMSIKESKNELEDINEQIVSVQNDLKGLKIEVTSLTNPKKVLEYVEKNEYKTVSVLDIDYLKLGISK